MKKINEIRGGHEDFHRKEKFKAASDRNFGVVFAIVFGLIGLWSLLRGGQHWTAWFGAATVFAILAIFFPRGLAPLNWLWLKFGMLLFHIVSPVMLAFLFYVCVTPIGLILRVLKKDILNLKRDSDAQTYWIARDPPGPQPETLKNQF